MRTVCQETPGATLMASMSETTFEQCRLPWSVPRMTWPHCANWLHLGSPRPLVPKCSQGCCERRLSVLPLVFSLLFLHVSSSVLLSLPLIYVAFRGSQEKVWSCGVTTGTATQSWFCASVLPFTSVARGKSLTLSQGSSSVEWC